MAAGESETLLRRPGGSQRATFLELFLDLVYVFALTRVSQRLINDFQSDNAIRFSEAGRTLLLLLALWMLWTMTAWMTSRFDPERSRVQVIVVLTMFGSMVMAVTLPQAYGGQALLFAGAYVVLQVGRPLCLGLTLRGDSRQNISWRLVFWFSLSGLFWIAGALVPDQYRWRFWLTAVVVDYGGHALRWPTPRVGRVRGSEWGFAGEHLAERYQQFVLIVLGESILVTGLRFSGGRFVVATTVAFVLSFLTTVMLWRIYFHQAGFLLAEAITGARDPGRFIRSATYTHLLMVAAILASAVGFELVIADPGADPTPGWVAVIVGGPALFVLSRVRFEYEVFGRITWSRPVGVGFLLLVSPAMLLLPALAVGGVAAGVLTALAVYDGFRQWGRPRDPASSPL
ncbi:low temperature requirement protein A [Micromonospora sp. NPDC049559]|uniref:low temperature requirement protein A n=1 Tax=Micromonospora sp. NPDC049559 TaxID=3155923 RepID=UPI003413F287